ncbi:MAG: hypothetical protein IRZ33_05850 [Alicyclobacillaceae bacterium]|nr:hypothetical protein [Alicyclobacillaceae bacterium]
MADVSLERARFTFAEGAPPVTRWLWTESVRFHEAAAREPKDRGAGSHARTAEDDQLADGWPEARAQLQAGAQARGVCSPW